MNAARRNRWLGIVAGLCALVALVLPAPLRAGPEIPGAPQSRPIALIGATVHPVSGPDLPQAVVLFDKGKLVAVGRDVAIPPEAERIELAGKHVYPGLIDAYTQLGLSEIHSVRGSVDETEAGSVNPNAKAQVAVNPDSEFIPVTRSGGVLTVLTAPHGRLVSGISAVIQLDGWTVEDMLLKPDAGLHINWPRMMPVHTWRLDESNEAQLAQRDKTLRQLRETLDDARAYWELVKGRAANRSTPPEHDARWEALVPVFEGRMPLFVEADEVQQIESAVALARNQGVKLVLVGGYDAVECAPLLKQYDVPVIVHSVTRLPQRRHDPYDAPYTLPARLSKAGIRYCIAGGGRMGNIRNLPYQAGMAAAFGLSHDEALKSVTLFAAEILGVADRIGSLDAGKDATLIVTDGDVLEIATHVSQAFIQGRQVDLSDRQKKLWQKYQEKYRRQHTDAKAR
jgi:imidazolonepropionase-like amidohydrolase